MEWINVQDRLPDRKTHDFSDWVLAFTGHARIEVARYDYFYKEWTPKPLNFTHWQSLPQPPKM